MPTTIPTTPRETFALEILKVTSVAPLNSQEFPPPPADFRAQADDIATKVQITCDLFVQAGCDFANLRPRDWVALKIFLEGIVTGTGDAALRIQRAYITADDILGSSFWKQ